MDEKTLTDSLEKYLGQYLPECEVSVRRNCHMNAVKAETPMLTNTAGTLSMYVLTIPVYHKGGGRVLDVLEAMSEAAKRFVLPFEDAMVDAVVVDFVNFVGSKNCCDYAMYTKDLR